MDAPTKPTSLKRILVVDDADPIRLLLRKILDPFGEVDEASEGLDAFAKVKSAWEDKKPYDLVTLDLHMNEFNGKDFLSFLRQHERDQGSKLVSKVLVVSAINDDKTVKEMLGYGCDGYVTKPFDIKKLREQVEELFSDLEA